MPRWYSALKGGLIRLMFKKLLVQLVMYDLHNLSDSFDTHESTSIASPFACFFQVLLFNICPFVGQLVPGFARVKLVAMFLVDGLQSANFTGVTRSRIDHKKSTGRERFIDL